MHLSQRWINGALVAAAAIAISYWFTWRKDARVHWGALLLIGIITFVLAFAADLIGDFLIAWLPIPG